MTKLRYFDAPGRLSETDVINIDAAKSLTAKSVKILRSFAKCRYLTSFCDFLTVSEIIEVSSRDTVSGRGSSETDLTSKSKKLLLVRRQTALPQRDRSQRD